MENCDGEKLFVLPTHNSKCISRLCDLSVADYVMLPIVLAWIHVTVTIGIETA